MKIVNSYEHIYLAPYNVLTLKLQNHLEEQYGIVIKGFIDNTKNGLNIYTVEQLTKKEVDRIIIVSPHYFMEIFHNLLQYIKKDKLIILDESFNQKSKIGIFLEQIKYSSFQLLSIMISLILTTFKIKIGVLTTDRIGELVLSSEVFLRRLDSDVSLNKQKYIVLSTKDDDAVSNKTLYELYRKIFSSNPSIYLLENNFIVTFFKNLLKYRDFYNKNYFDMKTKSNDYEIFLRTKRLLYFTENDVKLGNQNLQKLQIHKPYVLIFSRDSAYLKNKYPDRNWSYHDYRDADIDSFELVVQYLIQKGYHVVRIGSIVEKPFQLKHNQFTDYSFSEFKSDFMDIFLISQSEFIIGSNSGATDVACAFGIPLLGTNIVPIDNPSYYTSQDMFIPKKLKYNGEYLSLSRYIQISNSKNVNFYYQDTYNNLNFEIENNTPAEILELCKEYLGEYKYDKSFSKALHDTYFKIHEKSVDVKNVKTKIGTQFLLKNMWFLGVENEANDN